MVAWKPILGKIYYIMINSFLSTYQRQNFYIEDFVYILVICEARSVRSSVGFKITARGRQSSVGRLEFLWADYYTKIFCFCVHGGAPHLLYLGTSLYEHIL